MRDYSFAETLEEVNEIASKAGATCEMLVRSDEVTYALLFPDGNRKAYTQVCFDLTCDSSGSSWNAAGHYLVVEWANAYIEGYADGKAAACKASSARKAKVFPLRILKDAGGTAVQIGPITHAVFYDDCICDMQVQYGENFVGSDYGDGIPVTVVGPAPEKDAVMVRTSFDEGGSLVEFTFPLYEKHVCYL